MSVLRRNRAAFWFMLALCIAIYPVDGARFTPILLSAIALSALIGRALQRRGHHTQV